MSLHFLYRSDLFLPYSDYPIPTCSVPSFDPVFRHSDSQYLSSACLYLLILPIPCYYYPFFSCCLPAAPVHPAVRIIRQCISSCDYHRRCKTERNTYRRTPSCRRLFPLLHIHHLWLYFCQKQGFLFSTAHNICNFF